VSTPQKPDPARGWLFVEKLLADDDPERLDKASDEEVERQMREQGVQVSRVPGAEELLAKAAARAAKPDASRSQESGVKVTALPVRPGRPRWMALLAAAAIGGLVVAVVMNQRETPVAHPRPHDDSGGQVEPTPQERAAKLREEAFAACREARWAECESKLGEAKRLDPAGDADPRVRAAHDAALGGLHQGAGGSIRRGSRRAGRGGETQTAPHRASQEPHTRERGTTSRAA
jgi:hypothetical protein